MAIQVQCPSCSACYNVPNVRAGQKLRCKCGALVPVPPAGTPVTPPIATEATDPSLRTEHKSPVDAHPSEDDGQRLEEHLRRIRSVCEYRGYHYNDSHTEGSKMGNVEETCRSAEIIGESRDPRAIELLIKCCGYTDRTVTLGDYDRDETKSESGDARELRRVALNALRHFSDTADPQLVRFYVDRYYSDDTDYSDEKGKYLGRGRWRPGMGEKVILSWGKRAVPTLTEYLENLSAYHREAAAAALGEARDPRAVVPLIKTLQAPEEVKEVRVAIIQALGQIGDPRAVEPLVEQLVLGPTEVRLKASDVLYGFPGSRTVELLMEHLAQGSPDVRTSAFLVLSRIGAPFTYERLITFLTDTEPTIVAHAARALGRLGDPRAVDALIDSIGAERVGVGLSPFVWALGELRDARAIGVLTELMHDYDIDVRKEANEALSKIPKADDAGRPKSLLGRITGGRRT